MEVPCPAWRQWWSCRPITSGRAATGKRTLRSLCKNSAVCRTREKTKRKVVQVRKYVKGEQCKRNWLKCLVEIVRCYLRAEDCESAKGWDNNEVKDLFQRLPLNNLTNFSLIICQLSCHFNPVEYFRITLFFFIFYVFYWLYSVKYTVRTERTRNIPVDKLEQICFWVKIWKVWIDLVFFTVIFFPTGFAFVHLFLIKSHLQSQSVYGCKL